MKNQTTTATLPEALRGRYQITEPLQGGPRFALPHYGQGVVDFSALTPELADALIARGFPYLRRNDDPAPSVTPVSDEPDSPAPRRRTRAAEEQADEA